VDGVRRPRKLIQAPVTPGRGTAEHAVMLDLKQALASGGTPT